MHEISRASVPLVRICIFECVHVCVRERDVLYAHAHSFACVCVCVCVPVPVKMSIVNPDAF